MVYTIIITCFGASLAAGIYTNLDCEKQPEIQRTQCFKMTASSKICHLTFETDYSTYIQPEVRWLKAHGSILFSEKGI